MKLANFSRELSDQLSGGPAIVASTPVTAHAAGTASMHVASAVTIADAGNYYASGTVEGALQEIGTVHRIYDEGTLVGTATTGFNFVGSNVSGTVTSGTAIITVSGSSSSLVVYDEGILVGTPTAMDFIGSGVSAALSSGTAQVTITSGSAYSNIPIYDEGTLMGTATTGLNFTGSGVSGTVTSGTAVITVSGGAGSILAETVDTSGDRSITSATLVNIPGTAITVTFTAPSTGNVNIDLTATVGATNTANAYQSWGVLDSSDTVVAGAVGVSIVVRHQTGNENYVGAIKRFRLTGLTAGVSYTYKWAAASSTSGASFKANSDSPAIMAVITAP